MRSEDQTPIQERWLWLEGVASKPTVERVSAGLPAAWPPTAKAFFVAYAYAEIPVGRVFNVAFCRYDVPEEASARLRSSTQ